MKIHHFTLDTNNLNVVFIQREEGDVVSISLMGRAGSVFENVPGTAHFLEHLALQGSQKFPSKKELLLPIISSGGFLNAKTNKEFVEFYGKTTKSEVEKALEILSEMAFRSLFRDEDVEKERKVILHEIKRAESDNQRQLFETMTSLAYLSESMKRMVLGTEESVKTVNKDTLINFWSKYYSANNFVLTVCGDLSLESFMQMAKKYFGSIPSGSYVENPVLEINTGANVKVLQRDNANQARLMIAYPASLYGSKGYYASALLSAVLGRGALSRLSISVREEKQLAYDITTSNWGGANYSLFCINAGIDEGRVNETIDIIRTEQEKLINDLLTTDELDLGKKRLKADYLFRFEDSFQLATHHSFLFHTAHEFVNYEDELNKIDLLESEEIREVAREIFKSKPHIAVLAKELKEEQVNLPL